MTNECAVFKYLEEIEKIPPLAEGEEQELFETIARGSESEALNARKRLAISQLRMCADIAITAKRTSGRRPGLLTLIQAANYGLVKAMEKFDRSREESFIDYAAWCARQEVSAEIADYGRFYCPFKHDMHNIIEVKRAAFRMLDEGREIDTEEIAERLGIDPDFVADTISIGGDIYKRKKLL